MEENLFYQILVQAVKDYFSPRYPKSHRIEYRHLARWFRNLRPLEIAGLGRKYTFVEYCEELLDIPYSNAEAIRQSIITYKEGDENTRKRTVRDCFSRLEEGHEHNDPQPWWIEYNLSAERNLKVINPTVGPKRTYLVFS